ncbi:uncharacterized protein LOC106651070 [Trichogramma pretiosum]|uniref:uncharacterized protein LOC106651070 n=1 Tax=Trichogramma pretiosum TaxID=7493 RepID=UPI0006C9B4FB|nr:uncharacterized protein LOC106651070 [Trichogramma pretiosum]
MPCVDFLLRILFSFTFCLNCSLLNRFKTDSKMRQTSSQYVEITDEPLTGSLVSLAEAVNEVLQERIKNLRKDIEFVKTIRRSTSYQLLVKESDPALAEVNNDLKERVEKIQIEIASICKVVEDLRSQVKTGSRKSKTNNTFLPSVAV